MPKCFDCGEIKHKVKPAVYKDGEIHYVCRECWRDNWASAMHKADCDCGHCRWSHYVIYSQNGK